MKKREKFEIELTKVTSAEVASHLSKYCRLVEKRVYAWHSGKKKTLVLWYPRENQLFPAFRTKEGLGVAMVDFNPVAKGNPPQVCYVKAASEESQALVRQYQVGIEGSVGTTFHDISNIQNVKLAGWAKQFLEANNGFQLEELGYLNVYAVEAPSS